MKKKEKTFHLESQKAFSGLQLNESKQTMFCWVLENFPPPCNVIERKMSMSIKWLFFKKIIV